jgi:DNA-binding transcriptional ArsR family regulator
VDLRHPHPPNRIMTTTDDTTPPEVALDETLALLADPHRRRVVELLARQPIPAGQLACATGLSAPAMSRHLRQLRRAGLVAERHDGDDARIRIYSLRPDRLAGLRDWLSEVEMHWSGQLEAFRTHVEER